MFGTIVAVFVVFAIFGVVGSALTLYVWCIDPNQVRSWKAMLSRRRAASDGPAA
jgi:hypothetical protein